MGVVSYILVFIAGGLFGVIMFAIVIASTDRERDEGIEKMEISPDDARRAKKTIISYTALHESCRTCIFAPDCSKNWKRCPVNWETKQ